MDWAKFAEYGFSGIVAGTLFLILWKIIVWTMQFVKDQSSQQAEERKVWQELVNSLRSAIQLHNQQSIDAYSSLKEANNFQRAEHKEMINNLNEITASLGRINGYKDSH